MSARTVRTPGAYIDHKAHDYGVPWSGDEMTGEVFHRHDEHPIGRFENGPDAPFVAQCMNAHDALTARCARLEEALRRIEDETRDAFAHNWSVRVTRIQRIAVEARAALAEVQK